ncbi:glycine cleavage system protein GcvH [Halobellus limi]|jgi:glycine cleavage system H protein|uniref:Probable glycine cleavage system H protein n=1 Tax=Halobellus limi TaxID=699433 RepID=A0A1H6BGD0_9EURY|nr:glycine cleavage system protein GcvH [Halobellus limi]QCC49024.1 glycine cleavage system protein GcvH [Halobellus limi]SEG59664.1 glycine cleavage system H protein [Halobellus limi]
MTYETPDELRYTDSHEWIDDRGDARRIGITDFAQDELGDVVFVELPAEGESLESGAACAVVESIKAVSDIYTPVSGTVTATNDAVLDQPELLNTDPYGEGWLFEIDGQVPEDALDADEYREQIE